MTNYLHCSNIKGSSHLPLHISFAELYYFNKLQQAIERSPDLAPDLYNMSLIVEAKNSMHAYIMAANELDEPDEFKTAYNNPKEAEQFMNNVTKLTDNFMANIHSYNKYHQEEAYSKFFRKYTKELKELNGYFDTMDSTLVLDLVDDKLCKLIRKPEPDPLTIKLQTSEENTPTSHGVLQALAHESPTPALSNTGQAAVVQLFTHLQFTHENHEIDCPAWPGKHSRTVWIHT